MALSPEDLRDIDDLLGGQADPRQAIGDLRTRFRGMTVTQCDPSDVDNETPFRSFPAISLYLVDAADHCWRLTADTARATGLVVVTHRGMR